jgi:hypothetical protein
MPQVRSIADLLRDQHPEEELRVMAEAMRAEIARIQRDLEIVETALTPRGRRSRSRTGSSMNGHRGTSLKREDLYRFVAQQNRPVTPSEMRQILVNQGYDIRTSAVRTGMSRLVRDKKLVRIEEGLYAVGTPSGGSELEIEAPTPPGTLDFK